eukprot:TRINITY_DN6153_c0_g1_i1.p3 TRINITY_DN6153_c0_g1~~TRINITY_DN6153_c0_g1_i1.p3  ORF type:complete len:105 (+),score=35.36 TRINITY_DN6153_c0_g1_i1:113-427(+)
MPSLSCIHRAMGALSRLLREALAPNLRVMYTELTLSTLKGVPGFLRGSAVQYPSPSKHLGTALRSRNKTRSTSTSKCNPPDDEEDEEDEDDDDDDDDEEEDEEA